VRRGSFELLANFADAERRLPCHGDVVLATHQAEARRGAIVLPPFSGALIG
jgi:hypothetical protein